MEEKEIKALLEDVSKKNGEAIGTAVKASVADALKGVVTKELLVEEFGKAGLKADEIKTLSDAVVEQGKILKEIKDKANKVNEGKDIGELVYEQGEQLKKLSTTENKNDRHNFKINKTIVQRSSLASSTLGYRVPGIGQLPTRKTIMRSLFNNVSLSANDVRESNGVIRYIDQAAITRSAAAVAELAGRTVGTGNKPESAISWIERSITLETLADTIPVTKQSYRNLGFVAGEIDKMLRVNLALLEDTQLYSGDGNTPNLRGVYTAAPAVVLASLPQYQKVEGANLYDLIAALKVYIMNGAAATGKQSKYLPNYVVMNPADILKYKLLKATNGHYLLPPFISADGTSIDGIRVVEDSVVTVNTLVMGDFDYGTVYHEEEITIDMGLVNDQFLKNQWTIRAEQVEALLIRTVDEDAFVKVSDIDAAIAALELV
jgi:hypothetical protein